jgi:hypothetical protein
MPKFSEGGEARSSRWVDLMMFILGEIAIRGLPGLLEG